MLTMTMTPTATTLYEVIGPDNHTIGYFPAGDDARDYAATIPGAYVMIYLKRLYRAG